MPRLVTIRQSPSIARALILEARAARSASLGGAMRARVRAALARRGAREDVEFDVAVTPSDQRVSSNKKGALAGALDVVKSRYGITQ